MYELLLSPILHKLFQKIFKDQTAQFNEVSINLLQNLDKNTPRKLQISISCEYRCTNPEQTTNKLNSVTYKGLHTIPKCDLSQEYKVLTFKKIN